MRILVANRGEIARRIIRTAHRLGHTTVAVMADPDADAPFVHEADAARRIGPANLAESYLSPDAILGAAAATKADAVHPGYGFLSENAEFARAVQAAGLIWIGPHPDAIDAMGSKIEARRLAATAGVPVIPGFDSSQDDADLAAAAARIGYPVLLKAAAGGGGKGIRIATGPDGFASALREARAEADRSFGDHAMIVERYIQRPRHVEVQVIGDQHGSVVELGTRECSVQRRYQKLLEEAPAPNLAAATDAGLRASAVELARAIGYDSAGTVEFVVDAETGDYFFLEMNTRLQVEHPVTELTTGLDLVELQIRSACGEPLPFGQDEVRLAGHAFEARINAEDPSAGFAPQTGVVTQLVVPPDVRWDSAVEPGSAITPHYDPMIAKLIVHGPDRQSARRRLVRALDSLVIGGVVTNTGFHRWLSEHPALVEARVTTRLLDDTPIPLPDEADRTDAAEHAARIWFHARDAAGAPGPWGRLAGIRLTTHRPRREVTLVDLAGERVRVVLDPAATVELARVRPPAHAVDLLARVVTVNLAGGCHTFRILSRSEAWAPDEGTGHGHAGAIAAPFPAIVTEVIAAPGDHLAAGDAVVVIEAMKMLHTLTAAGPGVVDEVRVAVGDQVASNQVLVTFVTPVQEIET